MDPLGRVLVNIDVAEKPYTSATVPLDPAVFGEVKRCLGPNTDPWDNRRPELYNDLSRA